MNLLNHVWYKYIRGLHDRLHVHGDRISWLWEEIIVLKNRVEKLEKHNKELEEHLSRLENYVLKEAPRISACEEDISCMEELMRIAGWTE